MDFPAVRNIWRAFGICGANCWCTRRPSAVRPSYFRVAPRKERTHTSFEDFDAMGVRIASAVIKYYPRFLRGRPAFSRMAGIALIRGKLSHIISICAGYKRSQGYSLCIGSDYGAWCRVHACPWSSGRFGPPKTARTLKESTITRDQSSWSALCSSASIVSYTRCHARFLPCAIQAKCR